MKFQILRHHVPVGEVEADGASAALIRGRELYGNGCDGAVLVESSMAEAEAAYDRGAGIAPRARSAPARPEPASAKPKRSQPLAASGEGQNIRNAMGTTPQFPSRFRPSKKKTHSKLMDVSKSCTEKIRYPNSVDAHTAIRGLVNRKGRKKCRSMRANRCSVCHGWHITGT